MKKLTIIGDIVCDKEMLRHSRSKNKIYDFTEMFSPLCDFFKNSDYVIANMETVIDNNNFTKSVFSFSNPCNLLKALKQVGISCVSLANNHILDRGEIGISKTINYLEKVGMDYFGIVTSNKNGILSIKMDGVNISVLSYTDSTNYHINKNSVSNLENYKINLLRLEPPKLDTKKRGFINMLYHKLSPDIRLHIKKILCKSIEPIVDNYSIDYSCLADIKKIVKELKSKNNYVIMYPHMGGQFNIKLGNYSKSMIDEFKKIGVDSIVITHPHVIQEKYKEGVFSIGDVIISPNSKFAVFNSLPQYSLAINYYFEKKKLKKITISFLICLPDNNSYLKVYPFYNFYSHLNKFDKDKFKKEFINIYKRIFDDKLKIKDEYVIWED